MSKAVPISFIPSHAGYYIIHFQLFILTTVCRITNGDGRCVDLLPPVGSREAEQEETDLITGQTYKIIFKTKEYFQRTERDSFYPWVEVSWSPTIVAVIRQRQFDRYLSQSSLPRNITTFLY